MSKGPLMGPGSVLRLPQKQAVAARACSQSAIGQYVVSPWAVVDRKGSHANARHDPAPYPRAAGTPTPEKFAESLGVHAPVDTLSPGRRPVPREELRL